MWYSHWRGVGEQGVSPGIYCMRKDQRNNKNTKDVSLYQNKMRNSCCYPFDPWNRTTDSQFIAKGMSGTNKQDCPKREPMSGERQFQQNTTNNNNNRNRSMRRDTRLYSTLQYSTATHLARDWHKTREESAAWYSVAEKYCAASHTPSNQSRRHP